MITKYTKETLKEAIDSEDFIYEYTTHIADKLRAVYVLFGWVHMLENFSDAQDMIDTLTLHAYQSLLSGGEAHCQSAGLMVEAYIDEEGFVNLEYYFNLS